MAKKITYGIGGYDPSKPNNNIVEIIDIPDDLTVVNSPELIEDATE